MEDPKFELRVRALVGRGGRGGRGVVGGGEGSDAMDLLVRMPDERELERSCGGRCPSMLKDVIY